MSRKTARLIIAAYYEGRAAVETENDAFGESDAAVELSRTISMLREEVDSCKRLVDASAEETEQFRQAHQRVLTQYRIAQTEAEELQAQVERLQAQIVTLCAEDAPEVSGMARQAIADADAERQAQMAATVLVEAAELRYEFREPPDVAEQRTGPIALEKTEALLQARDNGNCARIDQRRQA